LISALDFFPEVREIVSDSLKENNSFLKT